MPLSVVRVQVDDSRGEGIEAAARRARYAAFAGNLRAGEWLRLLLDELEPADRVNVIRAGQPPRPVAPDLTDVASLRHALATLSPPSGGADLPGRQRRKPDR